MTAQRKHGHQSLLILHLHAAKLRQQGLHFGAIAQLSGLISELTLSSRTEIRDISSLDELRSLPIQLNIQRKGFDVIVVVAHSNASGIRVAENCFLSWSDFGSQLKPLRPKTLLLAACQAGRWDAGKALFDASRSLQRVFASPVNASKEFVSLMLCAVPYVVGKIISDDHVVWAQAASVLLTGRQLREWKRIDTKDDLTNSIYDLMAVAADPVARQVPEAVANFFKISR